MPHCFSRRYTDVCEHVGSYKMEELSNLIWLGGAIAEMGPAEFQGLWKYLRVALVHYIYGFAHTQASDSELAHRCLWNYAAELDRLVGSRKVRTV